MHKEPQRFPTPVENIALDLIFAVMGERRYNRTYAEYMAIAKNLPPLKVLTFKINQLLQQMHKCNGCNGFFLYEICGFKRGDQWITYRAYPKAISIETVRTALEVCGMRPPRWRRDRVPVEDLAGGGDPHSPALA
jgi:hypothetical protein